MITECILIIHWNGDLNYYDDSYIHGVFSLASPSRMYTDSLVVNPIGYVNELFLDI